MRTVTNQLLQTIKDVVAKNQICLAIMNTSDARNTTNVGGNTLGIDYDNRGLLMISALVVATGALFLALIAGTATQPLLLTLLAILAVLGAFFLFGLTAGHIQFTHHIPKDQLATALAQNHADAMMVTTTEAKTLWANSKMTALVGTTIGGEYGSLEKALGATPSITEAMFRLSRAIEQGTARSEELTVRLSTDAFGDKRGVTHARISVTPYTQPVDPDAPNDGPSLVLWSITNTSADRAREQKATAHSRATMDQYETMPVGMMTATQSGNITRANKTLCAWLGYDDYAEIRERNMKLDDVISSDAVELLSAMAAHHDEAPTGVDLDLIRKDSKLVPVRIMCQHPAPTETDQKSPSGAGLIITVLNRTGEDAEDATDTAAVPFAKFFRSAPFGIATIGSDGRIINTNASFSRMIVDGTRCMGQTALSVLSRSADEEACKAIEEGLEAVLSGRGQVLPVDILAGKKKEFTRRVYMSPMPTTNSAPDAAILYMIDATEEKALEAKYAQSQKMDAVGKLAGFVAHDFNNMLTAIIGFSDFLLQTHRPTDAAYSDIINIKSSANRAAGLVAKLLALARQQTLLAEPLQLGEVMTDLAPLLKRSIGERIELKVSTGRDLWHVKTDKLQFEQAIINLAVNARDAMPKGGRLTIRTRNVTEREAQRLQRTELPTGEYVLIHVEDTGTGIPQETLEKIFEPFFTTKAAGQGTGLGLATVYGIVKQSGGFIFPQSTVGKGTSFKIYLPSYELDAKDLAAITEKEETKKKVSSADLTGSGRVLLVEDEDVVRSFAVRALTRQGYDVLEAEDGLAALEVLEKSGPVDIVVSDVVMPGMDGPTMLKEMRKADPDLKIIFVSGYPNEAFQKALGEETFAFLPKPFSLPQLAAKVKEELSA